MRSLTAIKKKFLDDNNFDRIRHVGATANTVVMTMETLDEMLKTVAVESRNHATLKPDNVDEKEHLEEFEKLIGIRE